MTRNVVRILKELSNTSLGAQISLKKVMSLCDFEKLNFMM